MRRIEFEPTEKFDERRELRVIVAAAPAPTPNRAGGYTLEQTRVGIRVIDKLDAANGSMDLEEEEWRFLCWRLQNTEWARADRSIIAMVDRVTEAKEVTTSDGAETSSGPHKTHSRS